MSNRKNDTKKTTTKSKLQAVIWDYDGTLVDTGQKNFSVTRALFEAVTGKPADEIRALTSQAELQAAWERSTNWQDLQIVHFGMTEEQSDEAGRLWTAFQLQDQTETPFFEGVAEVITALTSLPQGIVSQNSRETINRALEAAGLDSHFGCVVGYEEVAHHRQKPAPDGLLTCLEQLTGLEPGLALYIGDHETDAQCALQANEVLKSRGDKTTLVSIGAFYGWSNGSRGWSIRPDYSAWQPSEIISIINRLGERAGN